MNIAWIGGQPGLPELLLLVVVLILLFGAKKLPELARSIGRSINEFKKGKDEAAHELTSREETEKPKDEDTTSS